MNKNMSISADKGGVAIAPKGEKKFTIEEISTENVNQALIWRWKKIIRVIDVNGYKKKQNSDKAMIIEDIKDWKTSIKTNVKKIINFSFIDSIIWLTQKRP